MPVEYIDYLPDEHRASAVHLYYSALKQKLAPILGDGHPARSALDSAMSSNHCLVAVKGGELAGILGLQTSSGGFLVPDLKAMIKIYGRFSGICRMAGLAMLHHRTRSEEIYIDGVAVHREMRGQGIGSGLFDLLEQKAAQMGIRMLSLDVIDSNKRAEKLYLRLGYAATLPQTLWPLSMFVRFPFQSATRMVKILP